LETYFKILNYVKPFWKHLSLSIICTIIYALLNGASIYLTIPLLDALFQDSKFANNQQEKVIEENVTSQNSLTGYFDGLKKTFQEFIFEGEASEVLLRICLLILAAFLGKNLFGYLQAFFLAYVEQGVIKRIRDQAYVHLHKLPMGFFKGEKTGNLISRILNDVYVIQTSVSTIFFNLIREPLTIVVFLGIAFSITWKLTLFSIVVIPLSSIVIAKIGEILRKQSSFLQEKMSELTTILHETISGVKIVKAFGMEDYENDKFKKQTDNLRRQALKMVRIRNVSSPVTELLSVVVGAAMIYYGGHLVLEEGALKASEFLGFLFAIFSLMTPIKELSNINNRIQESSAAADRVFEILETEPKIKDRENSIKVDGFNSEVEYKNVSFHYDDSDELVLRNISFQVNKGEIIAFVGSSGAGKTTVVDLLPRFFDAVKGEILLDGINIKEIKINDLRNLMGIVTQEVVLFNEPVKNNIAYGYKNYPEEEIIAAAKAANAHDFILELPYGYDTVIGERGTKLSGGQRQRISIARALLKNPPIMIFDEATSSLDNESEQLVQEAIERLMKDRTTFVIAHRLSTIRNANRIIVLDQGRIIQEGTHDELINRNDGLYSKLYEMQFRDFNGNK
jgi:subfamily B ATP-binding cassette protein MsbA